ncbi:MAG: hypothetical protein HY842_10495 [Bacteroidetes bacterium]|nr:hypothetical protein [Bacteroidota bacterium]
MTSVTLKQIIQNGIHDLPKDSLQEVANFVLFVRARLKQGKSFNEQALAAFLAQELQALSATETSHLEQEFENYQNRYRLEQVRN